MLTINFQGSNIKKSEIDIIVNFLKSGKVVVLPTDTIYGLHADALNEKAINKIRKIKKVSNKKAFIVLVSSFRMAKRFAQISKQQENYLKKVWPGPNSVILKNKKNYSQKAKNCGEAIAIRLPDNKLLIQIIKKVGNPIVSTSLNIHGKKPLEKVDNFYKYFQEKGPDLILDRGELPGRPSKLIDLTNVNSPIIRR